jgi:hypothetical protein
MKEVKTELKQVGQRIYLIGNTYPVRNLIRESGGKWDPVEKLWYVGLQVRERAEQIAAMIDAQPVTQQEHPEFDRKRTPIKGRAKYKGKGGYLVLWEGMTRRGSEAVKLAFRDGSKTFWADAAQVTITKRYGREDYRTGRIEYPTLESLDWYAKKARERETNGEESCWRCAKYCTCSQGFCHHHHDGCETCGAEG